MLCLIFMEIISYFQILKEKRNQIYNFKFLLKKPEFAQCSTYIFLVFKRYSAPRLINHLAKCAVSGLPATHGFGGLGFGRSSICQAAPSPPSGSLAANSAGAWRWCKKELLLLVMPHLNAATPDTRSKHKRKTLIVINLPHTCVGREGVREAATSSKSNEMLNRQQTLVAALFLAFCDRREGFRFPKNRTKLLLK